MSLLDIPVSTSLFTKYTKRDLQRITKLYIDLFFELQVDYLKSIGHQKSHQKKELKVKRADLYYEKSYIEYYHFC